MNNLYGATETFAGRFTPAIRKRIKSKRLSLGLSLQQLGDFLKINWSTIRKWESGSTTICHPRHIRLIQNLLDGEFDQSLRVAPTELDELASCWHKLPTMMHNCLERVTMIYDLCEGEPELRAQLMAQLNATANDAVAELAGFGGVETVGGEVSSIPRRQQ